LGEKIMVKIVTTPALVLSQASRPVKKIDKEIKRIISYMIVALNSAKDPVGVGLAAPQIGISLQIFITKPTINSKIQVFINPKIVNTDTKATESEIKLKAKKNAAVKLEGCLSLPSIWGEVKRKPIATISYMDENGNKIKNTFRGLMATIVQHEIDHLNGILFPKLVLEQKGILYKSEKGEKGEDVFEEIKI
jgi:peptide deformylase